MNRNDDFDRTLEAWLRGQAPQQAPDRVLDAALERVEGESQKRGWLQRFVGGKPMTIMTRVAAVAAVGAIAALIGFQFNNLIGNVGSSPQPSASPTPDASPSAPAPTDDAAASLVLRLMGGGEAGRVHLLTVLEDGRIITSDDQGVYVERRLTATGVQLLRDEVAATGLTDTSADYSPVANPGVEPPAYGGAGPSLEVGQPGGGTTVITWFLFGDTEQDYFQPQPEAETLEALLARLTTLDEWLPASAWADANATPYVPAEYRIFIFSQQWGGSPDDLPVETATVSWPLADGIDVYGDVVEIVTQEPEFSLRCRAVSAAEAAPVRQALEAAGATPYVDSFIPGTSFALGHPATSRLVTITLEPILPVADSSCGAETTF
jgi:hypothetical protein